MILNMDCGVSPQDWNNPEISNCWCYVEASTDTEARETVQRFYDSVRADRRCLVRSPVIVSKHHDFEKNLVKFQGSVRFARCNDEAGGPEMRQSVAEGIIYGFGGERDG